jgi:hypothetical protein
LESWQEVNHDFTGTTEVKRKFISGNQRHAKCFGVEVRNKTTLRPKLYERRRVCMSAHVYEARSKLLLFILCRKKKQNFDRSSKKWKTLDVTVTKC